MVLNGIKVVEVSSWAAAPSCGVWLAEFGADVIRIEPIDGDPVRGVARIGGFLPLSDFNWAWELWNRSKRGIAVNLGQEQGRDIVHKLVSQADVFLTNLLPHIAQGNRLDYETLGKINPRLIYASLTGYGPEGPGSDWHSFDEIAFWARSGIMSTLGDPGESLVPLRGAMGDHTAGTSLLAGIALALYSREQTGSGQRVDVSLLGCGCSVAGVDLQATLSTGEEIPRTSRQNADNPLYNFYQCKDGKWVQWVMFQSGRYWPGVCRALGRADLEHDTRFDSHRHRSENKKELILILDEVVATRDRDEWALLFQEHGLVWGPVQTMSEVVRDPCVLDNNYVVEYEHFSRGTIKGVGCPIQLSGKSAKTPHGAPEHSQHTEEVLLEIGYNWDDISRMKEQKTIP